MCWYRPWHWLTLNNYQPEILRHTLGNLNLRLHCTDLSPLYQSKTLPRTIGKLKPTENWVLIYLKELKWIDNFMEKFPFEVDLMYIINDILGAAGSDINLSKFCWLWQIRRHTWSNQECSNLLMMTVNTLIVRESN